MADGLDYSNISKESSHFPNALQEKELNVPNNEGKFTGLRRGYGEDENVRSVSPPMALLTMGVDGKPPSPELIARLWRAKRQRMEDEHWYKNTPRRDAASPTPSDGHETIETYAPKLNCNKIRTKIQQLIDSGEYKVTHFQRELGIASNSYGRFIKLKGPWNGADNKQREKKGIKTGAGANKKRKSNDGSAVKDSGADQSGNANAKDKKASANVLDVPDIHLDGEESNAVPVQDTPAEIRRKISAHIPKVGCTLADFCRTISKSYVNPEREVNARHLKTFRGQKGPDAGNMSPVYYAAFVYFEKLRLKQKKPKSTHRMELEKRFPDGYWTERPGPSGARLIMAQGDGFSSTKYGEFEMHQRGSMSSGIMNGVRNK